MPTTNEILCRCLIGPEGQSLRGLTSEHEALNAVFDPEAEALRIRLDGFSAEALSAHLADHNNPHAVTKAQIGLDSVSNDAQVKRAEMGAASGVATLDASTHLPLAQLPASAYRSGGTDVALADGGTGASDAATALSNLGAASATALTAHTGNVSNPHAVTKTQVGLGNVSNDAQVKRAEMGAASGVATLGADGHVPAAQLAAFTGQLAFPASQNGSSDPNTLDDYEEGTFSPFLVDANGHSVAAGTSRYVKVGSLVCLAISMYGLDTTALDSTGLKISGLPFAAKGASDTAIWASLDATAHSPVVMAEVPNNLTTATLYCGPPSGVNVIPLLKSYSASASAISLWGTICYSVN